MQLAEARDITAAMLSDLRSLADTNPELMETIAGTLARFDIQLPPASLSARGRGGGLTGSRTPSRASSVSSEASSVARRRAGTVQIGF